MGVHQSNAVILGLPLGVEYLVGAQITVQGSAGQTNGLYAIKPVDSVWVQQLLRPVPLHAGMTAPDRIGEFIRTAIPRTVTSDQ
jgi:hypothetical protein